MTHTIIVFQEYPVSLVKLSFSVIQVTNIQVLDFDNWQPLKHSYCQTLMTLLEYKETLGDFDHRAYGPRSIIARQNLRQFLLCEIAFHTWCYLKKYAHNDFNSFQKWPSRQTIAQSFDNHSRGFIDMVICTFYNGGLWSPPFCFANQMTKTLTYLQYSIFRKLDRLTLLDESKVYMRLSK